MSRRPHDLSITPRPRDLSITPRPRDLSITPRPRDLSITPRPRDLSVYQLIGRNETAVKNSNTHRYRQFWTSFDQSTVLEVIKNSGYSGQEQQHS